MSDVVITGTGMVSAAGRGVEPVLRAMNAQVNLFDHGVDRDEDCKRLRWPVARVNAADAPWPNRDPWWINNQKFASISARWAVAAATEALETARIVDMYSWRGGVVMAVPTGEEEGLNIIPRLAALSQTDPRPLATLLYEEVPDYSYVRGIPSQTGQFIAKASGFRGSNVAAYGDMGAGGFSAASLAVRLLIDGELDAVIIVGVGPPLSTPALVALDRVDPLAQEAAIGCGPFDAERRGTLVGQGGVAIVLERRDAAVARGIEPLAELTCCEAFSASSLPQAIGTAVNAALSQVDNTPRVWWAHATGSAMLDAIQYQGVRPLANTITTSAKGTIGDAFECAGLMDIALAVEALRQDAIPPIGLLRNSDPTFGDLDFVVGSSRSIPDVRSVLVTAAGHPGSATGAAGAAVITRYGA